MYLLLSFIVALVAIYYISIMSNSYNADTTYLTPIVILVIYSILSIIRELKREDNSYCHYGNDYGAYGYDYYGNVEHYKKKHNYYTEEVIHYPTREEVREKIKKLEDSRWFRFKRDIADIFGIDITKKYYKKYKKPYKEKHNRFYPSDDSSFMKKTNEYNSVVKHIGRSCEITFEK